MEVFRRYGMVLALLVVLSAGFGCGKKSVDVEQSVATECITPAPAINAAAETITDGIIYFDFDKYDIKSEYRDMLNKKAELLKEYPCIRVRTTAYFLTQEITSCLSLATRVCNN